MVACNHAHEFGADCNPECTHGPGCTGKHPTPEGLAAADWSQAWNDGRNQERNSDAPSHR